jgi:hypothetical protein
MEQRNFVPGQYDNYVQRKSRQRWLWYTLGGIGATIMALIVVWMVSANLRESAEIERMVSIADGIPSADWELTSSSNPKHDIGCIPFDQSCHKISRTWQAAEPVYVDELAAATGYDLEAGTVYRTDCADGWVDGVSIRLCVDGADIELSMRD